MDLADHSASSTPSDTPSDVDVDQAVFDQSKKLEEMKSLLKAQQQDLRLSLDALQRLEAVKPNSDAKHQTLTVSDTQDNEKSSNGAAHTNKSTNESSSERDPSEKRLDIQMCPICGTEFDNPNNPEALEEHVAAHWCSSESSGMT